MRVPWNLLVVVCLCTVLTHARVSGVDDAEAVVPGYRFAVLRVHGRRILNGVAVAGAGRLGCITGLRLDFWFCCSRNVVVIGYVGSE